MNTSDPSESVQGVSAELRKALQRIVDWSDCRCEDHASKDCCAEMPDEQFHCPGCIAARTLAALPERETPDIEALCRRSPLFAQFLDKGFWDAAHVDLVWRYNGREVREQGDWLKDVWYALKAERATPPEPETK